MHEKARTQHSSSGKHSCFPVWRRPASVRFWPAGGTFKKARQRCSPVSPNRMQLNGLSTARARIYDDAAFSSSIRCNDSAYVWVASSICGPGANITRGSTRNRTAKACAAHAVRIAPIRRSISGAGYDNTAGKTSHTEARMIVTFCHVSLLEAHLGALLRVSLLEDCMRCLRTLLVEGLFAHGELLHELFVLLLECCHLMEVLCRKLLQQVGEWIRTIHEQRCS
mmetsp:Transcript_19352/g.45011  ORF Transcript_19352/g.45011 Transcript_19352/m.45011 type:complete len:224 (-) Transcript_19352:60-731(-)